MRADLLFRCRRPPLSRQDDQALIVTATLYETGLLGVADRLLQVRIRKLTSRPARMGMPPSSGTYDHRSLMAWGVGTWTGGLFNSTSRSSKLTSRFEQST